MSSFPTKVVFNFFFLLPIFSVPSRSENTERACQFGSCSYWDIVLLPLLTEKFSQTFLLKAIIRSMLQGCRWYFSGQINIELATKNGTFVRVKDPMSLSEVDKLLDQFKFTASERAGSTGLWRISVQEAVDRMRGIFVGEEEEEENATTNFTRGNLPQKVQQIERGKFIFVITDFERSHSGSWLSDGDFLYDLDKQLAENGIFFRNVRLQFDEHKQTQIIPGPQQEIRESIRNISAHFIRVNIVKPDPEFDAFSLVRPCPQLTDAEKIREHSYVQHFYYENWLLRNPRGALIGFTFCLFAILCAISAFLFHLWEQSIARKNAEKQNVCQQQQQGGGRGGTGQQA